MQYYNYQLPLTGDAFWLQQWYLEHDIEVDSDSCFDYLAYLCQLYDSEQVSQVNDLTAKSLGLDLSLANELVNIYWCRLQALVEEVASKNNIPVNFTATTELLDSGNLLINFTY